MEAEVGCRVRIDMSVYYVSVSVRLVSLSCVWAFALFTLFLLARAVLWV